MNQPARRLDDVSRNDIMKTHLRLDLRVANRLGQYPYQFAHDAI